MLARKRLLDMRERRSEAWLMPHNRACLSAHKWLQNDGRSDVIGACANR